MQINGIKTLISLVGIERLELSRLAPHAPEACVYTNFTISPISKLSEQTNKDLLLKKGCINKTKNALNKAKN